VSGGRQSIPSGCHKTGIVSRVCRFLLGDAGFPPGFFRRAPPPRRRRTRHGHLIRTASIDSMTTLSAPSPSATARFLPGPSRTRGSAAARHRPSPRAIITGGGDTKHHRVAPTPCRRRSAAPQVPPRPPRRGGCVRPRFSDVAKVNRRHHRRQAVPLSMTTSAVTPTRAGLGP